MNNKTLPYQREVFFSPERRTGKMIFPMEYPVPFYRKIAAKDFIFSYFTVIMSLKKVENERSPLYAARNNKKAKTSR